MPTRLTRVQWLICVIAAIGFAFDIYELLMLPLIVGPALPRSGRWRRAPTPTTTGWACCSGFRPIAGGIFGLLGGYLTDRLGRRRVLTWSILLYALSAFAAGYSTTIWQFLFFRCTTFIGVCVEFVAAVAWLAEIFSEPKQRERVLGYTQAFSSIGGALVTAANGWVLTHGTSLPAIYGGHEAWRYTLMSGVIPALPLIIIRPFLPESPLWQQKKVAGTLKRPSLAEIFSPELRRVTIVTTLMFAMSYGAAFGAIQHMPRIVPSTPEVAPMTISRPMPPDPAGAAAWRAEVGAPQAARRHGRAVVAGDRRTRRAAQSLRCSCSSSSAGEGCSDCSKFLASSSCPLSSGWRPDSSVGVLKIGMFFAGLFTVAQFSFWGNYLPRVYPLTCAALVRASRPTLVAACSAPGSRS